MGTNLTASSSADTFVVYILRCADGSLYVGHTSNVDDRVKVHNDGRGAVWTACRRPITLVYHEPMPSEVRAVARERQIKHWTHAKKLALIDGDRETFKIVGKAKSSLTVLKKYLVFRKESSA